MQGQRKLFTAERKLLESRGQPMSVPGDFGGGGEAAPAEVMRELARLRADLARVMTAVGVTEEPEDHQSEIDANEAMLLRRQSEVSMLKTELRALAVCIEQTKAEIAALRPQGTEDDRLTAVAYELDAVVSATEQATDQILSASERLEGLARELRPHLTDAYAVRIVDDMFDIVVAIFEACNFQDLTGQRITKVVNTLKYIESRVNAMVEIWGSEGISEAVSRPKVAETTQDDEAKLLNGPQLGNRGISQDEIDKLFG